MQPMHETSTSEAFESSRAPPERPLSEAESTPIAAIMSRDVVCVGPDATVGWLMRLFIVKGLHTLPRLDRGLLTNVYVVLRQRSRR